MKKQIAIVTRQLVTGGVERALIAMLRRFDYDEVQVDLYVEHLGGELYNELPPEVCVRRLQTVHPKGALRHPLAAIKKAACMLWLRLKKHPFIKQAWLSSKLLLPVKKHYDIAISYHAPNTVPVFYVIDRMNADKKILWLHGDLETNAGNTPLALKYHGKYDKVFAVSKAVHESYIRHHRNTTQRLSIFHNYVDEKDVQQKAQIGPDFDDGFKGIRILSIGRLSRQKGFDMAVNVCAKLVAEGFPIRWYICGEGDQRKPLEDAIDKARLDKSFVLLGNRENPYTYLKNCDLYVQPSRYEGYCTTTNEARILHKPVITTDVSGAREQFEHQVTGWIVPIDEEAVFNQIKRCLQNPESLKQTSQNLKKAFFSINERIEKIWEI